MAFVSIGQNGPLLIKGTIYKTIEACCTLLFAALRQSTVRCHSLFLSTLKVTSSYPITLVSTIFATVPFTFGYVLFTFYVWLLSSLLYHLFLPCSAREALRQCLPEQLKDNTFSATLKDDGTTKKWLSQVLQNVGIEPPAFC